MKFGYCKAAALSPVLRVADCLNNAGRIAEAAEAAAARGIELAVFPELCLCGSTCGDLMYQPALLQGCEDALRSLLAKTEGTGIAMFVGLPAAFGGQLYNCTAVLCAGKLYALIPHADPLHPQFAPVPDGNTVVVYTGEEVPFGARTLFTFPSLPDTCATAVTAAELAMPVSPDGMLAAAGANLFAVPACAPETAGCEAYRRTLLSAVSAKLHCAAVYAGADKGESTTDSVFSSYCAVYENGSLLAESLPYGDGCAESEADMQFLAYERRSCSFPMLTSGCSRIALPVRTGSAAMTRPEPKFPFLPDAAERDCRCASLLQIQAQALARRLSHTWAKTAVVGISGGLDSCLALIAAVEAMRILGRPASDVIAVTMPCFGTTSRTRSNAEILSERLGASFRCISLADTTMSHFADIGHDPSNHDVTFENAQARGRTYILMDLANETGGMVIGTGDLSELALGWATYNGDHMSMYGVNAGLPKTLIRCIVGWYADASDDPGLSACLRDILATPVSPELLPAAEGKMTQITEDIVGPYELHDFIIWHAIRRGGTPAKIYMLLKYAFSGEYTDETLKKWLVNFYRRFFAQQFKRSCVPDGPRTGTVSFSPRGAWQMPSDAFAALWRSEAEAL